MFANKRLGMLPPDHVKVSKVAKLSFDPMFSSTPRDWHLKRPWDDDQLMNDQLGDCGPAAAVNWLKLMAQVCGRADLRFTVDDALDAYRKLGWDGTPATDNGVRLLDLMRLWYTDGIGGMRIDGFYFVGFLDEDHLATAVELCGPLIVGASLPIACQSTDTWDDSVSTDTREWGGHAFLYFANSPGMGTCKTWGQAVYQTPGFISRRWNECYLPICQQLQPKTGLDWEGMVEMAEKV